MKLIYSDGKTLARKGDIFACSKGNLELVEKSSGEIGGRYVGEKSRKNLFWFFVDECDFISRKVVDKETK